MEYLRNFVFNNNPVPLWVFELTEYQRGQSLEKLINKEKKELLLEEASRLVSVNKATLELYKAKNIEELRENFSKIIPIESYENNLNKRKEDIKGKYYEFETIHYNLDGEKINVLVRYIPEDTDSSKLLVSTTDITRYKRMLNKTETLAKLPEINTDIIVVIDYNSDKKIKYINPAGLEYLSINKLKSKNDIYNIFPDDFDNLIKKELILSNKNELKKGYRNYNKEYLIKIIPFKSDTSFIINISDVTEFSNMENEKNLLAETFRINHQPIIITDKTGRIIKVNKAATDYYGYSEKELLGQFTNYFNPGKNVYLDLGYTENEYNELFSNLWKSVKNPDIAAWDDVIINKTKSGKLVWVRLMISTVLDENRKVKNYIAMPIDISKRVNKNNKSKIELYRAIADLAEMRDQETANHMKRVGLYSKLIAKEIGKTSKYCNDIEVFAPLHDIGKVGISDSILLAARKLTKEEFEIMKTHTTLGFQILKNKKEMKLAAEITLNHHEKFNGKGYPNKLKGKEIPLSARITAIADVYDALRSKRPYKKPWSHEKAFKEILKMSGNHFDPDLVDIFKKNEDKFDKIYNKLKD